MRDMVYKVKADFHRGLGHPIRLKLIEELKHGEKSVGYLVNKFKIGQSSISRHLLSLRHTGILYSRQEKTTVYYAIADYDIFHVLRPIAVMLKKKFKASEKLLSTLGKE